VAVSRLSQIALAGAPPAQTDFVVGFPAASIPFPGANPDLAYTIAQIKSAVSTTTAPGGLNTDVQFNNGGVFGGNVGFTYDGLGVVSIGTAASETGLVKLVGKTSGAVSLSVQDVAGTWTGKLPANSGLNGQILTTDGGTPANLTWTSAGSVPAFLTINLKAGIPGIGDIPVGEAAVFEDTSAGNITSLYAHVGSNVFSLSRPKLNAATTFYLRHLLGTVTISAANPAVATFAAHGLQANDPVVFSLPVDRFVCDFTVAAPGVVTTLDVTAAPTAHGYAANDPIIFYSYTAVPTGMTQATTYFVSAAGLTATTFQFSATAGGASINLAGATTNNTNVVERVSTLYSGIIDSNNVGDGGIFFVLASGLTANTFEFSTTPGGAAISTAAQTQAGRISLSTGNDSNDGFTNSRTGAFLTAQGLWLYMLMYDFNEQVVTFQFGFDSTYYGHFTDPTAGLDNSIIDTISTGMWIGGGSLTMQGDISQQSNPGDVLIPCSQDRVRLLGSGLFSHFNLSGLITGSSLTIQSLRCTANSLITGTSVQDSFTLTGTGPTLVNINNITYDQQGNTGWNNVPINAISNANVSVSGANTFTQCTVGVNYYAQAAAQSTIILQDGQVFYGSFAFATGWFLVFDRSSLTNFGEALGLPTSYVVIAQMGQTGYFVRNKTFKPPGIDQLSQGVGSFIQFDLNSDTSVFSQGAIADIVHDYQVPTTGFSHTIADGVGHLILDPVGALLAGTVVMPPNPFGGQVCNIRTTHAITNMTFSPNAGQTVVAAPTTMTAGQVAEAIFSNLSGSPTWFF
jgi:hypothetical protein